MICHNNYYVSWIELSPHIVAEAFYNGEVESELRRIGKIDFRLKRDEDREKCMEMIEERRRQVIYPHEMCTMECQQRGINIIGTLIIAPLIALV